MPGPTLTNLPSHPLLDLGTGLGQRSATFRFELVNGVTNEHLGELNPIRPGLLTHDTTKTIKRQLNLALGIADTALLNPISDRVLLSMILSNNEEWPLGRYIVTDFAHSVYTSGTLSQVTLADEMFLVDQEIDQGVNGDAHSVTAVITDVLTGLPISADLEASEFPTSGSWGIGTMRGQILESLSVDGDYFSPWFGNDGKLHFIRTFDPARRIADFNFDSGFRVIREPIMESDDILTAPNRFRIISNTAAETLQPIVAVADVPPSAPHSIQNRGFVVAHTETLQLESQRQANAVVQGLVNRKTVFERVTLITPPDPRHDSYNVIKWQDDLWLELGWAMNLTEGGAMSHTLRKSYV